MRPVTRAYFTHDSTAPVVTTSRDLNRWIFAFLDEPPPVSRRIACVPPAQRLPPQLMNGNTGRRRHARRYSVALLVDHPGPGGALDSVWNLHVRAAANLPPGAHAHVRRVRPR